MSLWTFLCLWLTSWWEIYVISLRKVSWVVVVVGGGIAIIESAPGPDPKIWDGDGIEMTCTWPVHDLSMTWTWPGRGILSRGAMHFPLNFSQVKTFWYHFSINRIEVSIQVISDLFLSRYFKWKAPRYDTFRQMKVKLLSIVAKPFS